MRLVQRFLQTSLLVATLCLAANAHAQAPDLSGEWQGEYAYPPASGQPSVPFEVQWQQASDQFIGSLSEPNTISATGKVLKAKIIGLYQGQRVVVFIKRYDGTGGVSNEVEYRGLVSRDGNTIGGHWLLGDQSGPFWMTRQSVQ
jgi:hypothetical protein